MYVEQSFKQGNASISRRFGGSGLGLKISKSLCEAMRGSIKCSSQLGHGTTFSFCVMLPPCDQSLVEQMEYNEAAAVENDNVLMKCKILLVDDNVVNQRVGSRMLTNLGCLVTVASDGLQCLENWQSEDFDLILMDCRMPIMDGFTAAERIRCKEQETEETIYNAFEKEETGEHTETVLSFSQDAESERRKKVHRIPIIGLTASATTETKEQCSKCGMDACLTKPLSIAVLLSTLQEFIPSNRLTQIAGS